jgi:hypothetical protein
MTVLSRNHLTSLLNTDVSRLSNRDIQRIIRLWIRGKPVTAIASGEDPELCAENRYMCKINSGYYTSDGLSEIFLRDSRQRRSYQILTMQQNLNYCNVTLSPSFSLNLR